MTREEEIRQYLKERNISITSLEANSIIEGIEWADNNPKEYGEKIEQLEIKYFELFKKARQEDKEKLIAEACRWLEENIDKDLVIFSRRKWTSRYKFIKNFSKTLEDLK